MRKMKLYPTDLSPFEEANVGKVGKMKSMAQKMTNQKFLERYLDDFIQHGEGKHMDNMWKYARLNPMSDQMGADVINRKRIF